MEQNLVPGYLLHLRRYTDSRVLLDVFTPSFGRVALVARMPRASRPNPFLLFRGTLWSWRGRRELKSLTHHEAQGQCHPQLAGRAMFCGMYVNELLQRLLPEADAHPSLYDQYESCLARLSDAREQPHMEQALRLFEWRLIVELGFGLDLRYSVPDGAPIQPGQRYQLDTNAGFQSTEAPLNPAKGVFAGQQILGIASDDFSDDNLRASKHLNRLALAPLLGDKPLKSRELFV